MKIDLEAKRATARARRGRVLFRFVRSHGHDRTTDDLDLIIGDLEGDGAREEYDRIKRHYAQRFAKYTQLATASAEYDRAFKALGRAQA